MANARRPGPVGTHRSRIDRRTLARARMPHQGILALSRGLSSNPVAWDYSYQYNFYRDRTKERAFSPLVEAVKSIEKEVEDGIGAGLEKVKELVFQELSKFSHDTSQEVPLKGAFSGQRHRVWKFPKFDPYITIRFGGRIDEASDGHCMLLKWGPGGSITGKVPVPGLPPNVVTLRPSGSASIYSSYKNCMGDPEGSLDAAALNLTLACAFRGQVPVVDKVIDAFAELGIYVGGSWDLLDKSKHKYSKGWFARGVFDVKLGYGWKERYEFKLSSGGFPDIM